jgi:hypothetical protein
MVITGQTGFSSHFSGANNSLWRLVASRIPSDLPRAYCVCSYRGRGWAASLFGAERIEGPTPFGFHAPFPWPCLRAESVPHVPGMSSPPPTPHGLVGFFSERRRHWLGRWKKQCCSNPPSPGPSSSPRMPVQSPSPVQKAIAVCLSVCPRLCRRGLTSKAAQQTNPLTVSSAPSGPVNRARGEARRADRKPGQPLFRVDAP